MRKIRAFFARIAGQFAGGRRDRDFAEEIETNLQLHIADNIRAGMSPGNARREALLKFGGLQQTREDYRARARLPFFQAILQDLHYGYRTLRRSPGFTLAAALSVALGIGASTAIFMVIDSLMLRKLPVRDPDRLVMLREMSDSPNSNSTMSYEWFQRYRTLPVFSELSAISVTDRSNVTFHGPGGGLDTGLVRVALVSGNYFSMLGVPAIAGRTLTPLDDRIPAGHPVAVVSHAYADRHFGPGPKAPAAAIGRTLALNGVTYTILGVTPRNFSGEWVGRPVDVWIPLMMEAQVMVEMPAMLTNGNGWLRVVGRLQSGIGVRQAEAAVNVVYRQLLRENAGPNPDARALEDIERQPPVELTSAAAGYSPQWESFGRSLTILMMIAGLVLLIACANVANLLLARAAARHREISVRMAIGAARWRIVRQLLTENLLLSAIGGGLGMLLVWYGAGALSRTISLGPAHMDSRAPSQWVSLNLQTDWRVLGFATWLCLVTGLLFGLAPALRGVNLAQDLTARGAGTQASGARFGLGRLLVVSQVALSLLLLSTAGLFQQTLRNLRSQDLGIQRDRVLLVWTIPGQTGRQGAAMLDFWRSVQQRMSSLPGVTSAGLSNQGMLNGYDVGPPGEARVMQGMPPKPHGMAGGWRAYITPQFFESVGLPLVAGRDFTARDDERAARVMIVNESLAHYYFGDAASALGRRMSNPAGPEVSEWVEIVGVVKDPAAGTPRQSKAELTYFPYRQLGRAMSRMCIAVHTAGDPHSLIAAVRKELRRIDANIPILRIDTVGEQLDDVLVEERMITALAGFFGALGASLACVGLFGLLAYSTARRTNEIGIRIALGATRQGVLLMVLREALVLTAIGVAIGVPATLAGTRLISAKLFGVSAADPFTLTGAAALMTAVATPAGFLPALRASSVDPMQALHHE